MGKSRGSRQSGRACTNDDQIGTCGHIAEASLASDARQTQVGVKLMRLKRSGNFVCLVVGCVRDAGQNRVGVFFFFEGLVE